MSDIHEQQPVKHAAAAIGLHGVNGPRCNNNGLPLEVENEISFAMQVFSTKSPFCRLGCIKCLGIWNFRLKSVERSSSRFSRCYNYASALRIWSQFPNSSLKMEFAALYLCLEKENITKIYFQSSSRATIFPA